MAGKNTSRGTFSTLQSAKQDQDIPSGRVSTYGKKQKSRRSQTYSVSVQDTDASLSSLTSYENKQVQSPPVSRTVYPPQSQSSSQKAAPKRVTRGQKSVTGIKPMGTEAASTPDFKVKAPPLPGNASKTLKLAQRRVVPVANQKQKISPKMIPKRVVNPPGSRPIVTPIFKNNAQNKQRLTEPKGVSRSSSDDSDESDDSLGPKIKGIKPLPLLTDIKNESGATPDDDTPLNVPIECWRCGKSAPAKIIGEPSKTTHIASFLLCISCLTPCMFLPYWLDCSTTPTKRCAHCGAYLTEPPPRM